MAREESRRFELRLLRWDEVHELPGDWTEPSLRSLLEALEIEGVEDADLLEMSLMGLQDRDVDDAADLVLQTVFRDDMRAGVRQNLIDDLQDDRPWEEFADIRHQRGVFTAIMLLQKAFPTRFGKPDIARVEVEIQAETRTGQRWLSGEIDPALLLRLLAPGMHDRALLRRLFGTGLAGDHFPEAPSILWHVEHPSPSESKAVGLVLHSSMPWLEPLKRAEVWTAKGWPDAPPEESD